MKRNWVILFNCRLCNKKFSDLDSWLNHERSAGHQKKLNYTNPGTCESMFAALARVSPPPAPVLPTSHPPVQHQPAPTVVYPHQQQPRPPLMHRSQQHFPNHSFEQQRQVPMQNYEPSPVPRSDYFTGAVPPLPRALVPPALVQVQPVLPPHPSQYDRCGVRSFAVPSEVGPSVSEANYNGTNGHLADLRSEYDVGHRVKS